MGGFPLMVRDTLNWSVEEMKFAAFISADQYYSVNDTRPLLKQVQVCRTAMKSQGWVREDCEVSNAQSKHSRDGFFQLIHQKLPETYYQQVFKGKGKYWRWYFKHYIWVILF